MIVKFSKGRLCQCFPSIKRYACLPNNASSKELVKQVRRRRYESCRSSKPKLH